MSKIGILYLATGPYIAFWKQFFDSFEKHFMNNSELIYYVFSDSEKIYQQNNVRVKQHFLAASPWPLVTLLRFHTFLSIEEELTQCDYLMFFNANMACYRDVEESELLKKDKDIFVVTHPAFYGRKNKECPFERNEKSTAYIPYNIKTTYVQGAVFGGKTNAFLQMARVIKENIDKDLKNNFIAKWHDESQLNRYIINKNNILILPPSYCYPYGMDVGYEKIIYAVGKKEVFDIDTFKNDKVAIENNIMSKVRRKIANGKKWFLKNFLYIRDCLEKRK